MYMQTAFLINFILIDLCCWCCFVSSKLYNGLTHNRISRIRAIFHALLLHRLEVVVGVATIDADFVPVPLGRERSMLVLS